MSGAASSRDARGPNAAGARVAPAPPAVARALLWRALPDGLERECVIGDFSEDYARLYADSPWGARVWYWREALGVAARALSVRMRHPRRGSAGAGRRAVFISGASNGGTPGGRPPRWRRVLGRVDTALTADIPYAARNLIKSPGFAAVAILSLALGIAPLAVVGGFLNALFVRPAPYVEEPDRLVAIFRGVGEPVSWPDLADVAVQADGLAEVAASNTVAGINLTEGDTTRELMGAEVSTNYFDVLRVPLLLGRGFADGEMGPGAEPVVVISHTFWKQQFAGAADALGQTVRINGRDHTVIGVAPEGLISLEMPVEPDVYIPLRAEEVEGRGYRGIVGVARLDDGVTLNDVRAQMVVIQERLREAYPGYWRDRPGSPAEFGVYPVTSLRVRPGDEAAIAVGLALVVLLGVLVLITACANLGNLLLARGWQRGGEIAVRLALGADRPALVLMLLAESVLLACSGGAVATLVAYWLMEALQRGLIGPASRLDIGLDWRVLAFTGALSIVTGIVFGLVPALRASSPALTPALKGGRTATGRGRALSFRNVLVAGQVAASLALLISAAVLLRSVQAMRSIDPGFEPQGVATVLLDLAQREYGQVAAQEFFEGLTERLARLGDVESVALATDLPLDGSVWMTTIVPEGVELPADGHFVVHENRVSPEYFDLMRMPILRGRGFVGADLAGGPSVVLVNEAFEQRFWPEGAIGKRLTIGEDEAAEVVGVVRNASYRSLGESPTPLHLWRPWQRDPTVATHVLLRARRDPRDLIDPLRRLVREADPELPLLAPRLMTDVVGASSEEQRVASMLLSLISVVALSLSVVGIYGVLSFVVSRRTGEVGLRVALGAQRSDVVRMVFTQGMRVVFAGVVVGLVLAFGIVQVLAAGFAGVEALDPVAPAASVLLLGSSAALATLVPALRASRIDPMAALRAE
ncbi:MAG: ABC transporter permease [Acidobacteriota bacterium]|jgi:predicted permease